MNRVLLWVAILTLIYALALASFDPWDLALGALASLALLLGLRAFLFGGAPRPIERLGRRLLAVPGFVWSVLRDITVGTWNVAAVTLGLRPLERPGIVALPFGERTPDGALLTAFAVTLSPGEFLVDIDWEERRLLFHALDASDPDAVRARLDDMYRRHQRDLLP